jgi:argininosuccinate lyase
MPFRDAHHVTGALVKMAEDKGCDLHELTLVEMQTVEPNIQSEVVLSLALDSSVGSRASYGGTSPKRVREQIERWRERLG